MNSKLIKLLVSILVSLCLVIAGEWLYASYMRHRLLASINSAKQQDYKADELPEIDLTKQPEESYVDLVDRPLFLKGRRPVEEPHQETVQTVGVKPENFDWELSGVYSTKKTVSALFSRSKSKAAKDNYRKITLGDDLDGWKLVEINKDRALLKRGSGEKELPLRKPKSKALPPPQQPPAAPPSPFTPFTPPQPAPAQAPAPAPAPIPAAIPESDTSESNQ
ncbi:hypothetical protein [Candidatus Methylobacter oryzae]|uniref:DUF2939 domain-containing protein n=1 Tax=Candidatus Methylobacter oryzae TaxID=2497749 RepID=A0ABY3C5Y8_9GAMM|nr:hypothetical protein [Candidatus Methylobacter oryzae]TRW90257.1 hypothetical protein EKO24_019670 [Candidatus Methylobacter oryzae]